MKTKTTLLLLLMIAVNAAAQTYSSGYTQGYNSGQTFGNPYVLPRLAPLPPMPRLGESNQKDGYLRGFLDGNRINTTAFQTSVRGYNEINRSNPVQNYSYYAEQNPDEVIGLRLFLNLLVAMREVGDDNNGNNYLAYYELALITEIEMNSSFHKNASYFYLLRWEKDKSNTSAMEKSIESCKTSIKKGDTDSKEWLKYLKKTFRNS